MTQTSKPRTVRKAPVAAEQPIEGATIVVTNTEDNEVLVEREIEGEPIGTAEQVVDQRVPSTNGQTTDEPKYPPRDVKIPEGKNITEVQRDAIELYRRGYSIQQIAEKLGKHQQSVRTRLERAGVLVRGQGSEAGVGGNQPRNALTPAQQEVVDLVNRGMTVGQIAKELKLHHQSARTRIERAQAAQARLGMPVIEMPKSGNTGNNGPRAQGGQRATAQAVVDEPEESEEDEDAFWEDEEDEGGEDTEE
jgi:DNA-binding NarL/FixJ family response regulator